MKQTSLNVRRFLEMVGLVWYLRKTIDLARDPLQSGEETYVAPPNSQRPTIEATRDRNRFRK
jgi:hypothetical protein